MIIHRWLPLFLAFAGVSLNSEGAAPTHALGKSGDLPLQFEETADAGDTGFSARATGFNVSFDSRAVKFINGNSEVLQMRFVNAHADVPILGQGSRSEVFYHSISGSIARHAYQRIEYRNLYPGIHVAWHGTRRELEYDFIVDPGADPASIGMRIEGGFARLDQRGGLLLGFRSGDQVSHRHLMAFQEIRGARRPVAARFRRSRHGEIGVEIGPYDRTRPLIVDPVVSYGSYLGGTGSDVAYGITTDSDGFAYLIGETGSMNFPGTSTAVNTQYGATFITKLDTAAKRVVFTAILAANGRVSGRGIGLDSSGAIYAAGLTTAPDFPTTAGAFRQTAAGQSDAFFSKLSANGATLLYSTILGGSGNDYASAIAVSPQGDAFVAGYTSSTDFPVTPGSFQTGYGGGSSDSFVAKFNSFGTLSYATFIGGDGPDLALGVAVDASGSAFLAGYTGSTNFPVVAPIQAAQNGQGDTFVSKLNATGSVLLFSTYLGGSGADYANAIVTDAAGSIYVAGTTMSWDFPVTAGAFQRTCHGSYDAFVTKISGSTLAYSTYLGGRDSEVASALALDASGNLYVSGYTFSNDFPIVSSQLATGGIGQSAFLSVINPGGTALSASIILHGSGQTTATGVSVDAGNSVYLTGSTSSDDFLSQDGVGKRLLTRQDPDAFLVKLTDVLPIAAAPPSIVSVNPSSGSGAIQTFAIQMLDPTGNPAISSADILFTGNDGLRCHIFYIRSNGALYLAAPDESAWLASATLGSSATLQHAYCSVNVAASSATPSGNTLTLDLALGFTAAFSGPRTISADVYGSNNLHPGMRQVATWSVPGGSAVPSIVSVNPPSGGGTSQVFTISMLDTDGFAAVSSADMLFTGNDGLRCHVFYIRSNGALYLAAPDESAWLASATLGSSATLQHAYCSVKGAASSATSSGNTLTLNLALGFTAAFGGSRILLADVYSANGLHAGLRQVATWSVPSGAATPSIGSVNPSSGSGASQTFAIPLSDPDGNAAISTADVLFIGNDGLRCHMFYVRGSGVLYLAAPNESAWLASATLGSSATLQHAYCSVNVAASSAAPSGTLLTLNLALGFTPAFGGSRILLADVSNANGLHRGYQQVATWSVPAGPAAPSVAPAGPAVPSMVSVTPSSGSSRGQTFAIQMSDTDGNAAISSADILFTGNDGLRCHVFYIRGSGALYLAAPNESAWLGSTIIGSSTALQHAYCSINASASSVTVSGNTLTLNLALGFTAAFAGSRTMLADVFETGNLHPGLRQLATWSVP